MGRPARQLLHPKQGEFQHTTLTTKSLISLVLLIHRPGLPIIYEYTDRYSKKVFSAIHQRAVKKREIWQI